MIELSIFSFVKGIILLMCLLLIFIVITVVFPFIVQERLMFIISFAVVVTTVFHGKSNSDTKVKYEITEARK